MTVAGVLFALFAFSRGGEAASVGQDDAALDALISKLASPDCGTRWAALEAFIYHLRDRSLEPLRSRVQGVNKPVQERLLQLLEDLDQSRNALSKADALANEVTRLAERRPDRQRAVELDRLRQRFLRIINDPKEPFSTRHAAAASMSVLVTEFAREATKGWRKELPKLLQSKDPQVRLIGSLVAARRGFVKGQDPRMGQVIPILIGGLRGASFDERRSAQEALLKLTNVSATQFCVDPTDAPELRAAGIRRWDEWWEQNKAKVAREKIQQHWE